MKAFVTGVTGQLGFDCAKELVKRGHCVVGSGGRDLSDGMLLLGPDTRIPYIQLDITDGQSAERIIREILPDVVIHCAAWTNVDGAESPENRDMVYAVNTVGTKNIAKAAAEAAAKLIYISTDYVFDGRGERPWSPEDVTFRPLNVYGKSKLDGEAAVLASSDRFFIVRTAWVFGLNGKNFINTMIRVGNTHDSVRVVADQIGTPTYTADLARLLIDMAESDKYGVYHATNSEVNPGEYISWYDFCCEIYRQLGMKTKIIPVSTEEYGLSIAARPKNSRMDKSKLEKNGFRPLPSWQDALKRYLKEKQLVWDR